MNTRLQEWAEMLVDYSAKVESGDLVQVAYAQPARPLAKAVVRTVLDRGAHPVRDVRDEAFDRIRYEHGSDEQLTHIPDFEESKVHELDAQIKITAPENTRELSDVPSARVNRRRTARKHLRKHRIEQVKWVRTQYPSSGAAQDADMSVDAYREFVFDACVKDWEQESQRYLPLKDVVDTGSEVHIYGDNTDLTFSIGEQDGVNRVGVLSDGTHNVPGGEVFTTPVKESLAGEITFEMPTVIDGKAVKGINLVFENGKVVDYSAAEREDLLDDLLATDEGARYMGEFGIGTNFAIDRFTKNILFDEKIGGTIHLALGLAYPFCLQRQIDTDDIDRAGISDERFNAVVSDAEEALRFNRYDRFSRSLSDDEHDVAELVRERFKAMDETVEPMVNRSAVHQDLIKDLRDGGGFEIDGETVLEDGSFADIDTLP